MKTQKELQHNKKKLKIYKKQHQLLFKQKVKIFSELFNGMLIILL